MRGIRYKTVFIEHLKGGRDIQLGNTQILEQILNKWEAKRYEFVDMKAIPF